MTPVYILLTFVITCLGTVSGISGGTILKPVMDMAGGYKAADISVLTGGAVFVMSLASFLRNLGSKGLLRLRPAAALMLGLGAVCGGFAGQSLLAFVIHAARNDNLVKLCQNIVLGILLLGVLARTFMKNPGHLELRGIPAHLAAGVFMGVVAAFLGIGGGPINMALLMFLFGMDIKTAAVHSLLIILFAQAANLLTIVVLRGFSAFRLPLLPHMALAALAGSLLGAALNKKLNPRGVLLLFGAMLCAVLCAVAFNIVRFASQ